MTDRARRLLDNLLGTNRNTINNKKGDYCIYYIAGGCPYEILKNSKLSLGNCKYKIHEFRDSVNIILYEQELLKVLQGFFDDLDKKINKEEIIEDREYKIQDDKEYKIQDDKEYKLIEDKEYEMELKIADIEENIEEENLLNMYSKFQKLEVEISNLEKMKEAFFVKNKEREMEKCDVCGLNIIKNFCSKKYIGHLEGRAHCGVKNLRKLFINLKNKRLQ